MIVYGSNNIEGISLKFADATQSYTTSDVTLDFGTLTSADIYSSIFTDRVVKF